MENKLYQRNPNLFKLLNYSKKITMIVLLLQIKKFRLSNFFRLEDYFPLRQA